jgi:hypothetical protein
MQARLHWFVPPLPRSSVFFFGWIGGYFKGLVAELLDAASTLACSLRFRPGPFFTGSGVGGLFLSASHGVFHIQALSFFAVSRGGALFHGEGGGGCF